MPDTDSAFAPQQAAPLDARLEGLLFATGSAMSRASLARTLGCTSEELQDAAAQLRARTSQGGTALIETDGALALVTAPAIAPAVSAARASAAHQEIGQAGLEVLAIVLYRGQATRAMIDYIRGVNSAATVRTLSMRGLIERKKAGQESEEEASYQATPAAYAHLGVTHASDLPRYEEIRTEIAQYEARAQETSAEEHPGATAIDNTSYED